MAQDKKSDEEAIQRELSANQKFSLNAAIGRQAGGLMKGASPVPRAVQAATEIDHFVEHHLTDSSGALTALLRRRVKESAALLHRFESQPLRALEAIIQTILADESALQEFVRQVDVYWGQRYHERPHFQQPDQPAHPEDEYTHASVRRDLSTLLAKIGEAPSSG
ncbi:hypothetical protein [Magnetofaba australis]|uniref:Uncharacterized protein n=1 Tax=Magnetofaba australis IT-1 TaxID=1434232 RepID=A0A1Y2K430_9PROT|nr:hypothetical protein [Magnetofaba australis]OSM04118.1 hypothetical protein MAIT1_03613 [Magnetofaba australis IT-1]